MGRRAVALTLALVVVACRRDEPRAGGRPLSHWREEATQVSLFSFWNSTKDERRREAFRRLIEIGEPAVPTLVELLRQNQAPVSGDAFNALAQLGPRAAGAAPEMLNMLNGEDAALRRRAAWILGTIGPAAGAAVPSLTSLLRHPDPRLRQVAAQALGQIGGSGHVALERARTSGDVREREASMRGEAARPLDPASRREALASGLADPSPEVRLRAVDLLTGVGGPAAEVLAEHLVKALNDPDPRVNEAAHSLLTGYLQHGSATPRLLAAVLEGGDAAARGDVAWRLGNGWRRPSPSGAARGDPEIIEALLGALNDAEPEVRVYAGRALAYGGGRAAEQAIRRLRRDMPGVEPILGVRAARVLWDVAHDVSEVKPAYEAGLADTASWNRVETISAIMSMGKDAEAFVPHFERLSGDPAPEVRDRAEKALHAIRRQRAAEHR